MVLGHLSREVHGQAAGVGQVGGWAGGLVRQAAVRCRWDREGGGYSKE